MYDFDTPIDRRGSDCYKWDAYGDRDIIPMPVADMDFAAPPAVLAALRERIDHGVFGYAAPTTGAINAVVDMLARDHQWDIQPHWLVWLPGLEVGLNLFCRMLQEHEAAITTVPIYPPFLGAPANMGRRIEKVRLLQDASDRYIMDEDALEASMRKPDVRALMLCNPHNPSGRVYDRAELERLASLCLKHDMLICSDEIHCGLILDEDRRHTCFATLSPEIADRTITMMSPSKTFNIAGLKCAFAIIPNPQVRASFRRASRGLVTELNAVGYVACEAAYRHGEDWRRELVAYLRANRDHVEATLGKQDGLVVNHSEATYLAWIDCRQLEQEDPFRFFLQHGVALSDGRRFDDPGYVRLNFGCPRATLDEGLRRICAALTA